MASVSTDWAVRRYRQPASPKPEVPHAARSFRRARADDSDRRAPPDGRRHRVAPGHRRRRCLRGRPGDRGHHQREDRVDVRPRRRHGHVHLSDHVHPPRRGPQGPGPAGRPHPDRDRRGGQPVHGDLPAVGGAGAEPRKLPAGRRVPGSARPVVAHRGGVDHRRGDRRAARHRGVPLVRAARDHPLPVGAGGGQQCGEHPAWTTRSSPSGRSARCRC